MTAETVLRIAFGLLVVIAVTPIIAASRRARRRHGSRIAQAANDLPWLLKVRLLLAIPVYAGLADWLAGAGWFPWAYTGLPPTIRWAGVGLGLVAAALIWWTHASLGDHYHGTLGLHDEHRLVTRGPYRWVRHPTYVAFPLLLAAVWLLSDSWLVGAPGLLLVLVISVARAPVEERQLVERFGDEYRRYARRTPRFVPFTGGDEP